MRRVSYEVWEKDVKTERRLYGGIDFIDRTEAVRLSKLCDPRAVRIVKVTREVVSR